MPLLDDLLARGYFPRELPPPFSSAAFAQFAVQNWPALPLYDYPWSQGYRAICARYDTARQRGLRRHLSIPNPFSYLLLGSHIAAFYPQLQRHILAQPRPLMSVSRPVHWQGQPRALIPRYSLRELPRLRLRTRIGARYLLRTDIASFYGSIYTHSIPWALHTKAVAKRNRGASLHGNVLDRAIRNGQDGQTVGIPIGPDSSLLIAECLLRPVDDAIRTTLGGVAGFRYIDDYELAFPRLADAERARAAIERTLAEYELQPNAAKTAIHEAPLSINSAWVEEVRDARRGERAQLSARDLARYADIALRLGADNVGEPVLKFAVSTLSGVIPSTNEAWQVLQGFLLNAIAADAGTLVYVIDLVDRLSAANFVINRRRWEFAIGSILDHHAPLRHAEEVSWALWAMVQLGLRPGLTAGTITAVSEVESDPVALLALHYNSLLPAPVFTSRVWEQWMTTAELQQAHWLVAYEANIKGWLPSVQGADNVQPHPLFSVLKNAGVSFYAPPPPGVGAPAARPIPGGAIGNFSV